MKGLIIKDFYATYSQIKMMLVISIILTIFQGVTGSSFIIIFLSMMPITAAAYDERGDWCKYASMMPYGNKKLVLSKYIFSYLCMLIGIVISFVVIAVYAIFAKSNLLQDLLFLLMMFLVGNIMININLPLLFKFGVEKSRFVLFFMIFATVGVLNFVFINLMDNGQNIIKFFTRFFGIIILILGIVIFNILSYSISTAIYAKKEF